MIFSSHMMMLQTHSLELAGTEVWGPGNQWPEINRSTSDFFTPISGVYNCIAFYNPT